MAHFMKFYHISDTTNFLRITRTTPYSNIIIKSKYNQKKNLSCYPSPSLPAFSVCQLGVKYPSLGLNRYKLQPVIRYFIRSFNMVLLRDDWDEEPLENARATQVKSPSPQPYNRHSSLLPTLDKASHSGNKIHTKLLKLNYLRSPAKR